MGQYTDQAAAYADGDEGQLGFLVGQVMKISKGKANPQRAADVIKTEIKRWKRD